MFVHFFAILFIFLLSLSILIVKLHEICYNLYILCIYKKLKRMVIHLFGDKLKELRISKNLSQEELGEIFEVRKSSISNWETGKATPTFDMLTKIAQYFGVTIDYLLNFNQEDADNMEKLKIALKEAGMWNYDMDDMSREDFEKAMKILAMLKKDTNK